MKRRLSGEGGFAESAVFLDCLSEVWVLFGFFALGIGLLKAERQAAAA
jgi:hypothetical protein